MQDYSKLFQSIKDGIAQLAQEHISTAVKEGIEIGNDFIDETKDDIKNWADELSRGDLKEAELKDLVLGKKDLMKIEKLTAKGLLLIEIDKFRNSVIDLATGKILEILK